MNKMNKEIKIIEGQQYKQNETNRKKINEKSHWKKWKRRQIKSLSFYFTLFYSFDFILFYLLIET